MFFISVLSWKRESFVRNDGKRTEVKEVGEENDLQTVALFTSVRHSFVCEASVVSYELTQNKLRTNCSKKISNEKKKQNNSMKFICFVFRFNFSQFCWIGDNEYLQLLPEERRMFRLRAFTEVYRLFDVRTRLHFQSRIDIQLQIDSFVVIAQVDFGRCQLLMGSSGCADDEFFMKFIEFGVIICLFVALIFNALNLFHLAKLVCQIVHDNFQLFRQIISFSFQIIAPSLLHLFLVFANCKLSSRCFFRSTVCQINKTTIEHFVFNLIFLSLEFYAFCFVLSTFFSPFLFCLSKKCLVVCKIRLAIFQS